MSETYFAWSVPGGDSARTDRGWEGKGLTGLSNIEGSGRGTGCEQGKQRHQEVQGKNHPRETRANTIRNEEGRGIAWNSMEVNLDGVYASWSLRVLE